MDNDNDDQRMSMYVKISLFGNHVAVYIVKVKYFHHVHFSK